MSSIVREANLDDVFDLLVLLREFSREAPDQHKWDKDKTEATLLAAIQSPNYCVFVIEGEDGTLHGTLLGTLTEPFLSRKRTAVELAWFVSKEFRGRPASLKLVSAYEDWAKRNGAGAVVMADLTGLTDLGRLYKRLGYAPVESSYYKDI